MPRIGTRLLVGLLAAWGSLAGVAHPADEPPQLVERTYVVSDIVARDGQPERVKQDVRQLAESVPRCFSPDAWEAFGGPGTIAAVSDGTDAKLVIKQFSYVHEDVASLLKALRNAARDTSAGRYPRPYKPSGAEKVIQQALDQKTTFQFDRTPLDEVARSLSKSTGVKFVLDVQGLEDVGIERGVPMTSSLKNISLRSALRIMLRELDLVFIIRKDNVMITTPEEASEYLRVAVYPVSDLIDCKDKIQTAKQRFEELEDVIVTAVEPYSWSEVGGPGDIEQIDFGNLRAFVITQTTAVHRTTSSLLDGIRKLRDTAANGKPSQTPLACGLPPLEVAAEEAIRKALEAKVSMTLEKIAIRDVATQIADLSKANVLIDRRAFADVGLSGEKPVSLSVKDVAISTVLDQAVWRHDLAWMIRDEVLWITTEEEAQGLVEARIHPVGDLVTCRGESGELWDDYRTLADVVEAFQPDSWEAAGGPGIMMGLSAGEAKILIVAQSHVNHRRMDKWLGLLRAMVHNSDSQRKPPLRKAPPLAEQRKPRPPSPPPRDMRFMGGAMF